MKEIKKFVKHNLQWFIVGGVSLLCALFLVFGHISENGQYITLDGNDAQIPEATKQFIEDAEAAMKSTIEYSDENVPATIVTENGEETVELPTIESIDGTENPEDEEASEEDGRGAYHNTKTYLDYYHSVGIGNCINNSFGAQCFALANDFWQNYAGRALSSCGTGAAKGTLKCYSENAGNDFVMVWDAKDLQPGDWVVFTSGTWGHIGMAMGYNNNGYISLFGQNQGGGYCAKGGAATNVVNISLSSFGGAFRPKTYIKPNPEPTPTPTPSPSEATDCKKISVKKGDTMSAIMKHCTGKVDWGNMNEYANSWVSEKTGQTVFYGWTHGTGYGLLYGDTITYTGK